MNTYSDVIATLHMLPSPRGVALELMRLARHENASVADVAKIVRVDPALTGRLIHAANRMNAGRTRTGVLNEAVLRLGFSATRHIALGFSLVGDYRSGHCAAFDYAAFWTNSLLRGISAQTVASRAGGFDPQDAFVCGLLAGVGRMALATAQPHAYAELIEREGGGARLQLAERQRFAIDHAELGVALLERWGFPDTLVRTVREFHAIVSQADGQGADGSRQARMMVLAEALAQGAVANAPPAWKQVALDAATPLALDADALSAIAADTVREMSAWAPLLELPIRSAAVAPDYREYESPGPDAAGEGHALNILLVDDSEDERDLVSDTLERAGHRVQPVASGDEALAAIISAPPQMVITDWAMPGMDGITLCRALRATRLGSGLYVIMYTGRGNDSALVEGIEAGADDFLTKSANTNVLLARVRAGARAVRRAGEVVSEFRDARLFADELAAGAGQALARSIT